MASTHHGFSKIGEMTQTEYVSHKHNYSIDSKPKYFFEDFVSPSNTVLMLQIGMLYRRGHHQRQLEREERPPVLQTYSADDVVSTYLAISSSILFSDHSINSSCCFPSYVKLIQP